MSSPRDEAVQLSPRTPAERLDATLEHAEYCTLKAYENAVSFNQLAEAGSMEATRFANVAAGFSRQAFVEIRDARAFAAGTSELRLPRKIDLARG